MIRPPGDDKDNVSYADLKTGDKTQFDGKSYYVISNHLGDSSASTPVSTGDETADKVITKYASDSELAEELLKEIGVTKYIQLYDFEGRKTQLPDLNPAGNVYLNEFFIIIDGNGKQIARFRENFASNILAEWYKTYKDKDADIILKDEKSEAKWFAEKFGSNTDDLRLNYYPTEFKAETITDDMSKKYMLGYSYKYKEDGKVELSDDNLNWKQMYRHYFKINEKNIAAYYFFDNERISYTLDDSTGSYFYRPYFITKDNGEVEVKIQACGTSAADRTDESRDNTITARFNTSSNIIDITAALKGKKLAETGEEAKCVKLRLNNSKFDKAKTLLEQKVKVESGTDSKNVEEQKNNGKSYTFAEAVKAYFADYIRLSDKTVVVNGCSVPEKIYMRANFAEAGIKGHDFLNVELVPVATEDSFKYVGLYKTNSDGTYADAFADCRASETAMKESDYVPSYAKLYGEAYEEIVKGSYTGKTDNPFSK